MSGAACQIIIEGQALTGDILGVSEILTESDLPITEVERAQMALFLEDIRVQTANFLKRTRQQSNSTVIDIVTSSKQLVGNLDALCDSATDSKLSNASKEELADYLREKNKEGQRWLDILRKRATNYEQ